MTVRYPLLFGAVAGGITSLPAMALFYLGRHLAGFPFLPGLKSGLVGGITPTATYIAERIGAM